MKEVFKQLIIDFHKIELPKPSTREITVPSLPERVHKAMVLIGIRRSGKTWTLYQEIHRLIQKGIPKEKIVYLNFEDDRLSGVKGSDLQDLLDAYFELYPDYADAKDLYFFFDEIHTVDGWERFIRRILDTEDYGINLSGSSAKMLSKDIATTLRGRTLSREIFPFNFREFLQFKKVTIQKTMSTKEQALVRHYCKKYLEWGGFPEVADANPMLHREVLQSYINVVIYRDIIERHGLKNPFIVKQLILQGIQNAAGLLSINKIFNRFKSLGYTISKNSLYQYMEYFEDAYALFNVPVYNFSGRKQSAAPKKIYPADTGFLTALSIKDEFDHAARLETVTFLHLRRKTKNVFYYYTKSGKEIDFLAMDDLQKMYLYQACVSVRDSKTLERETSALRQGMKELGLKKSAIVTLDEEKSIRVPEGQIEVLPLWKCLMMSDPFSL